METPARQTKYNHSDKGRAARQRYQKTEKGKIALKKCKAAEHRKEREESLRILRLYGMTTEKYKQLLQEQDHKCAICNMPFDHSDKNTRPKIDHNHITNKNRGLLCLTCNFGLGIIKENITTLQNMIRYLRRHSDLP